MQVKDKIAVICGATSGIGKELARRLVELDAKVIFSGTSETRGSALARELNHGCSRPRAMFVQCDVRNWDEQAALFKKAESAFGGTVDIVIIVAGILDSSDLIDDEEQDGTYMTIEVNLTAALKTNRLAIQYFSKHDKPGCVINTSSLFGTCAAPLKPMYAASKHGIIGLTKSYGALLYSTPIRVNAIAPHFVETPLVTGEAREIARQFGIVTMERCVDAYIQIILDDSLNGDIITITSDTTRREPRYLDPLHERITTLSQAKQQGYVQQFKEKFAT